jgi:hypothetical protein
LRMRVLMMIVHPESVTAFRSSTFTLSGAAAKRTRSRRAPAAAIRARFDCAPSALRSA